MSYLAHYAATFLHACLDRGFTTVRDVGGADVGLAQAMRDGLLQAVPRLFYGGRVISQTGGHGDFTPGDYRLDDVICCGCAHADPFAMVADGADAVRRAVREELRRGASHVKIMASGGIASPPILWSAPNTPTKRFVRRSTRLLEPDRMWRLIVIPPRQSAGPRSSACALLSMPL